MKSFYLFICLIFGLVFPKSQVKFHNITFPYFETKKIVKPSNTIKSTNRLTKKLMQIVEYNQFGQQHGTTIIYRNDGSPSSLNYFHNGKRVYQAIPFQNSFNIQKVFNYDDSGNFDGTQSYTYLNNDDNKWHQIKLNFKNGRLVNLNNEINLKEYTINFENGKLNGEFYFYDNINCNCYYFGNATNGEIKSIGAININKDLTFEILIYKIINNEKISYLRLDDYRNPRNGEFEIFQNPIVIENNSVKIEDSKSKIVFDKQLNWLNILKEIATIKEIKTNELEKIDLSDAMYGAPAPYTLPSKKN